MSSMYLGDGVYASEERGMVKLVTKDGLRETNTIFLEDYVAKILVEFFLHIGWMEKVPLNAPPDDIVPAKSSDLPEL